MALAIPAFAFALYPAIQIPFALIMAVFIIGGFVKHWKELNERFLKGDRLTAEERDFYANYKLSSEYQTQLTLEELGLGVM